jgi:hypothetical protein
VCLSQRVLVFCYFSISPIYWRFHTYELAVILLAARILSFHCLVLPAQDYLLFRKRISPPGMFFPLFFSSSSIVAASLVFLPYCVRKGPRSAALVVAVQRADWRSSTGVGSWLETRVVGLRGGARADGYETCSFGVRSLQIGSWLLLFYWRTVKSDNIRLESKYNTCPEICVFLVLSAENLDLRRYDTCVSVSLKTAMRNRCAAEAIYVCHEIFTSHYN